MRIGVISDTHGRVDLTQDAVRMLQSLEVEQVLHCGDIGGPEVVRQFHHWPTSFVLGNCDYDPDELREAITQAGQTYCGLFGDLTLHGVRIALLHSHHRKQFNEAVASQQYALVCYGHSHIAAIDQQGATTVLNPGAVYRARPTSVAVVELPQVEATIVPL